MKIAYVSGYASWWGRYPKDVLDADHAGRTVGGGEAGMLASAFELAAAHDEVTVYACAEPGEYRGAVFKPESAFYRDVRDGAEFDALVAWSDPKPLAAAPDGCARLLVQQLNDLLFWPGWEREVDVLVSPSRDHAEYMRRLGWQGAQAVMHNGCAPSQLAPAPLPSTRPLRVGYWSSPDRGLHHLLRAWPRVRREVVGAELHVFYEIDKLFQFVDNQGVSGEAWHRLKTVRDEVLRARADASVVFHGATSRTKLYAAQRQVRVMCYPSDGLGYTEGFCHPPGTLIETVSGLAAVERFTPSCSVIGHSGLWRRVRAAQSRRYDGLLYCVVPAIGFAVELTGDHRVLAAPGAAAASARESFAWVAACDLRAGMFVYSPSEANKRISRLAVDAYDVVCVSDGQRALRVREVTSRPFVGDVYSITVEHDESYVVGNFVVHNCVAALDALCAGALPITRPVDALPSLWDGVARWLPLDTSGDALEDAIVHETVRGLTEWSAEPRNPTLDAMRACAARYVWENAGREMRAAILQALAVRRGEQAA